jgi:hypothetical protein
MLNLEVLNCRIQPHFGITLWHCDQCTEFISIGSEHPLDEAFCPVCGEELLELSGKLKSMPAAKFGDA